MFFRVLGLLSLYTLSELQISARLVGSASQQIIQLKIFSAGAGVWQTRRSSVYTHDGRLELFIQARLSDSDTTGCSHMACCCVDYMYMECERVVLHFSHIRKVFRHSTLSTSSSCVLTDKKLSHSVCSQAPKRTTFSPRPSPPKMEIYYSSFVDAMTI